MLNRRKFLGISGSTLVAGLISPNTITTGITPIGRTAGISPMIHVTDLYHLHNDPDDHWDLASVYSLAYTGLIDLKGVLIDYPWKLSDGIEPDVMGVAQMNCITGLVIPTIVGSPFLMKDRNDIQADASKIDHQGINWVLNILRTSPSPVIINIVGAATDIAIAAKKEPDLFRKKCKGIYLNAGSGYNGTAGNLEYNVLLNPYAYAAVFDVPCPIYWLPCKNENNEMKVGKNGSFFRFLQSDILPYLPERVQNYYLFMFRRTKTSDWFSSLINKPDEELLNSTGAKYRSMWCTAGFLHAAGKKVTSEGNIVSSDSQENSVFSFKPVKVSCDDKGITTWTPDNSSRNRFILNIDDVDNYQNAMTIALKNLLLQLPK